jgi:hypothetical protein
MARWNNGRVYPKYAADKQAGSSAAAADAAAVAAGADVGNSAAAGGATAAGAGTGAGASNSSNSQSSSAVGLLPLPEVAPYPAEAAAGSILVSAAAFWDILEDQKDCSNYSPGETGFRGCCFEPFKRQV